MNLTQEEYAAVKDFITWRRRFEKNLNEGIASMPRNNYTCDEYSDGIGTQVHFFIPSLDKNFFIP
jgi:hypothetical protein